MALYSKNLNFKINLLSNTNGTGQIGSSENKWGNVYTNYLYSGALCLNHDVGKGTVPSSNDYSYISFVDSSNSGTVSSRLGLLENVVDTEGNCSLKLLAYKPEANSTAFYGLTLKYPAEGLPTLQLPNQTGVNGVDTNFAFTVNGTSYFNNNIQIGNLINSNRKICFYDKDRNYVWMGYANDNGNFYLYDSLNQKSIIENLANGDTRFKGTNLYLYPSGETNFDKGGIHLYSNNEGGNIRIYSPSAYTYYTSASGVSAKHYWEIDAFNGNLRFANWYGGSATEASKYGYISFSRNLSITSSSILGGDWITGSHIGNFIVSNFTSASAQQFYQSWFSGKVKSGAWSLGGLSGGDNLYFVYGSDTNYNNSTNQTIMFSMTSSGLLRCNNLQIGINGEVASQNRQLIFSDSNRTSGNIWIGHANSTGDWYIYDSGHSKGLGKIGVDGTRWLFSDYIQLHSTSWGSTLPSSGIGGQIFFKI